MGQIDHPLDFGVVGRDVWSPDDAVLNRIKRSYRLAIDRYRQPPRTMWGEIDERRAEIHETLTSEDNERCRSLLSHPEHSTLYMGTDIIGADFSGAFAHEPGFTSRYAQWTYDHLLSAAESIGAIPLPHPEAKDRPVAVYGTDEILDKIDRFVSGAFRYPNPFPGEWGLLSARGVISWKVPMAIYQAHRLSVLAHMVGGARVLEIGPGVGRTALHARQLGLTDYTTIDLPLGVVAQACFLTAVLGPEAIWMTGDEKPPQPGQIRLLPPGHLDETPEDFDIILNTDSLTEMPREQAEAYFRYAAEHAKVLYSINHEVNQFRVSEMQLPGVTTLRHPCAIRAGYVEEYFFMPRRARAGGFMSRIRAMVAPRRGRGGRVSDRLSAGRGPVYPSPYLSSLR
jgi:hypothetical protein